MRTPWAAWSIGLAVVGLAGSAVLLITPASGSSAAPHKPASARPSTARSSTAATATAVLRYDYEFAGTTGTVANAAPAGPVATLRLAGAWTASTDGVRFTGNTKGKSAVAYGRPTGYTLNDSAATAVGIGVRLGYRAPATGRCFSDTPNVTQIGRYVAFDAQAKIQLSKCATNPKHVVVECRFAGSKTPIKVHPVSSTLTLIDGDHYNVSCTKSADTGKHATVTLTVANLDATGKHQTVTTTVTVAAVGRMRSRAYVSAGNKYPLPAPANNTDQYTGQLTRSIFCAGALASVKSCLASHLPAK